jgi:WD40 repeat protein
VTKINLSPDRAYLATSDESGVILIWDLRRGQLIKKLTGHENAIRYVVFSHDGRWLATGGDDGTTRLWDTSAWEQHLVLDSEGGSSIISVAFWPDDSRLVTVTNNAVYTIWALQTGEKWASCKVAQSGLDCQESIR